ncbi:hypothetical protein J2W55_003096 [Mucilaginibacter pocheonensis]|uniref:Uncharacterized protein n=1 Tax=Mucilaginibacter pocheonensis TaxID=398050 RepID=A0ABU1TCX0_9SPHI|nr:hypothetical protein [Mucilaginibacter pocheonensis]
MPDLFLNHLPSVGYIYSLIGGEKQVQHDFIEIFTKTINYEKTTRYMPFNRRGYNAGIC